MPARRAESAAGGRADIAGGNEQRCAVIGDRDRALAAGTPTRADCDVFTFGTPAQALVIPRTSCTAPSACARCLSRLSEMMWPTCLRSDRSRYRAGAASPMRSWPVAAAGMCQPALRRWRLPVRRQVRAGASNVECGVTAGCAVAARPAWRPSARSGQTYWPYVRPVLRVGHPRHASVAGVQARPDAVHATTVLPRRKVQRSPRPAGNPPVAGDRRVSHVPHRAG